MTKKDVQVNFRMPEELKAALEKTASANGRSLTAEIVWRLSESLSGVGSPHLSLEVALKAHDGDKQALLISETKKLREFFERLEQEGRLPPLDTPTKTDE